MIANSIYALCAVTSLTVAVLLFRQSRRRASPLLFWSVIGFLAIAANNIMVFVDLGLYPGLDLVMPRTIAGAAGMLALLYGLIRSYGS